MLTKVGFLKQKKIKTKNGNKIILLSVSYTYTKVFYIS